ncbi:MAG TPA: DUF1697 domain-containing protein [Sunxiuqinia sp.]|nr:DUF1697 domain-containing protein [Sunxiuqinia sp.]
MNRFLAILRGINVGGKNKIKMADLVGKLRGLNLQNLHTYIQSGNLIFDHPDASTTDLAGQISNQIKSVYGFDVPVIVLSQKEWQQIIANNLFAKDGSNDVKSLYVTFLAEAPKEENYQTLERYLDPPNEFFLDGKAVYLFCPNGYSKTKMGNQFFERKLQVTATTRNWKTTLKLAELAAQ